VTGSTEPEAEPRLREFADLLRSYGARLGLVGPSDLDRIWDRHIQDSLRGLACLRAEDELLIDVGSGGGLPGIPIALADPGRRVMLLEPVGRRVAFLEMVVERLRIPNASVVRGRTDTVSIRADVCLARAFAPPVQAWKAAIRLLNHRGLLIYYAGRSWNHAAEVALERAEALSGVCQDARFSWQGPIVSISRAPTVSRG
jgi:16S rRNA (guanine527-N7)-methyltransferase